MHNHFTLFAIEQFFDCFENLIPKLDAPLSGILLDSLTLAILVLFFLTIVRTGNITANIFHNPRLIGMFRTKKEGKKFRKCCLQEVWLPD